MNNNMNNMYLLYV